MSKRLVNPISPAVQHLAEQVGLRRRRKRLTQGELAEAIGCSPATISNLETLKMGGVTIETLVALARVLETPIDVLLGLQDDTRNDRKHRPPSPAPRKRRKETAA